MSITEKTSTRLGPVTGPRILPVAEAIVSANGRLRITALKDPPGLRIVGDLDLCTLPTLVQALAEMAGSASICIDLSGLAFIDVGGLRTLVSARPGEGHMVTLRSVPAQAQRLLELTGWHHHPGLRLQIAAPAPVISPLCRLRLVVTADSPSAA
ncbi:STAS domain-containing protein [Nonomuraea sp. LPB2021202275-12-8]|uniref:STAS domain-containing protein n=1 Tax=Nonomuraea sp. LPB2021202275-12-8 TaxID=3120159 RepID=UPI00300C85DA